MGIRVTIRCNGLVLNQKADVDSFDLEWNGRRLVPWASNLLCRPLRALAFAGQNIS